MDLTAQFIECNFLYDCISQFEMKLNILRPQVNNNIGSGKYQLMKKIENDKALLKQIYDEHRVHILREYEKQRGIEFELLKTPSDAKNY